MSLPGTHLCEAHQGNTSHYDPRNCTICQLAALLRQIAQSDSFSEIYELAEDAIAVIEANP